MAGTEESNLLGPGDARGNWKPGVNCWAIKKKKF